MRKESDGGAKPLPFAADKKRLGSLFVASLFAVGVLGIAGLSGCDDGGDGTDPSPSGDVTPRVDAGPETPQAQTLPRFEDISLYNAQSPYNSPIGANPTVASDSAILMTSILQSAPLVVQVRQYSSPVYFADASTPRTQVELTCGAVWEMGVTSMIDVPIPTYAIPANDVDGADNPIVGCGEESDQDDHLVVLDLEERCEYDLWQARRGSGGWQASWGSGGSLDGTGVLPNGLSTRASGFLFSGGMIWPDEVASGQINHALAMSFPLTKSGGPVAPATDSDGITNSPSAIAIGTRMQLNPDLDLDTLGLEPYERAIAQALQVYGLFVVDTGSEGAIGLYAVDPKSVTTDPWINLFPDEVYVGLTNIPLNQMRVLEVGAQDANWANGLGLPSNCVQYR